MRIIFTFAMVVMIGVSAPALAKSCSLPVLKQCERNADCNEVSGCVSFENPCVEKPSTVQFCINRQMTADGKCTLFQETDGSHSVRCKQPAPVE